jgi:SAM-dependent methyltransferase
LDLDLPPGTYDCIVTVATFHHLPLEIMLQKTRDWLKPGGILLVLDLFHSKTPGDLVLDLLAVPLGSALRLLKTGKLQETQAVRAAWAAHGIHDVYQPLSAIRQACGRVIPCAQLRRHLLWRYSLVWKKPILS